jgi:hypothetical protein
MGMTDSGNRGFLFCLTFGRSDEIRLAVNGLFLSHSLDSLRSITE